MGRLRLVGEPRSITIESAPWDVVVLVVAVGFLPQHYYSHESWVAHCQVYRHLLSGDGGDDDLEDGGLDHDSIYSALAPLAFFAVRGHFVAVVLDVVAVAVFVSALAAVFPAAAAPSPLVL